MPHLKLLIPYRALGDQEFRRQMLADFLAHMRAYLRDFPHPVTFVVAEQGNDKPFNRGKLLNAAFLEARQGEPPDTYYCQHNVDCFPRTVDYSPPSPGCFRDVYGEQDCVGCICLHDAQAFERVNGFPNDLWGWGADDYALDKRIRVEGVPIDRTTWQDRGAGRPADGCLQETDHVRDVSPNIPNLRKTVHDVQTGGYRTNGINSCEYTVLSRDGPGEDGVLHLVLDI